MVQLYYYENRGRCARKLLRHDGYSGSTPGSSKTRVLLFPYEGWAQPAAATYWLIKTVWWSRTRCKIIEVNSSHHSLRQWLQLGFDFDSTLVRRVTTDYLSKVIKYTVT